MKLKAKLDEIKAELVDESKVKKVLAQPERPRQHDARPPGRLELSAEDFAAVRTLGEAVEVVKKELIRGGRAVYAPLLSDERVRDAIRTGIRSYEAYLDSHEPIPEGGKDYFIAAVKPVLMEILEQGTWPSNCSFSGFYTLGSPVGITYDGFWLRLRVDTSKSKGKFAGFALPILDLAYGKVTP